MKNQFSVIAKLVAVAACTLTLGSCNRAEYVMLPKGASYHGVSRAATPVPASPATTINTEAAETPTPVASESVVAAEPVASPQSVSAPEKAQSKAAAVKPNEAATAPASAAASATTTAPAPKLNALQRLALNKMTRKLDKAMHKATARQHDNTASTARGGIDGNLRIGLILVLIGVLIGLINGLIGTIIAIIGIVFIVLWLLDQL